MSLRWAPVTNREVRALTGSKYVWLLALFAAWWGFEPSTEAYRALGATVTAAYLQEMMQIIVPLGIIVVTYRRVHGERRSGSLKLVLGAPISRREYLFGKFLGLTIGIVAPLTVGIGLLATVGGIQHGTFSIPTFLAMTAAVWLYTATLISVTLLVSTVVRRRLPAIAACIFGLYFVGIVFWNGIARRAYSMAAVVGPVDPESSAGVFFVRRLAPQNAFNVLTNWILSVGNSDGRYVSVVQEQQELVFTSARVVETTFETEPAILQEWLSIPVLLAWTALPFALARWSLARQDLTQNGR